MITQADFFAALEAELQLTGLPFRRADLLAFIADAWPLVQDDPSVERWASEFLASERQPAHA